MLAKKGIKDKKLEDLLKNVKGKGDEILDDILSKEGKDGKESNSPLKQATNLIDD